MIDLFRILKLEYKDYLLLFKNGSFYSSFDEDSLILKKVFNYKIVYLNNNIKAGFPINNIDLVTKKMEELSINYIIIDDKKIIKKYENDANNFSNYTSSVFNVISVNYRMDKIIEILKNIDSDKLDYYLNKIEEILSI